MLDALFHLLEYAGVVANDAQIVNVAWDTVALDRARPRLEVELIELPAEARP